MVRRGGRPSTAEADSCADLSRREELFLDVPILGFRATGPSARAAAGCTEASRDAMEGSAAISEYEQERLATIQSNRAKLVELGLEPAEPEQEAPKTKAKRERNAANATPREPTRQSKRVRSAAPDYTGVKIDAFGDDEPKLFRSMRRSSSTEENVSDVDDEPDAAKKAKAAAAVREAALAWASSQKERAATSAPLAPGAEGWRAEAVRRWGDKAALADTNDWEAYVTSRTSTPPPPSPLELMQVRSAELGRAGCPLRPAGHLTRTGGRCPERGVWSS